MGGLIGRLARATSAKGRDAEAARGHDGAVSAPPLGFEIYLEHYKGSFGDKWMWTPIVLTPPLTAAGVAGVVSRAGGADRAAGRLGALLRSTASIGVVTHVQRRAQAAGRLRRADVQPRDGAAAARARLARAWSARSALAGGGRASASGRWHVDFRRPAICPTARRRRRRPARAAAPAARRRRLSYVGRYPDYDVLSGGRSTGTK